MNNICQSDDELDNFHIPHINTLQWYPSGNKEVCESANCDYSERPFGVYFFLEDSRAKTLYVHVKIDNELSQHIKIDGEINFWFNKNNDNYLESILIDLCADGFKKALENSFNFVNSILSMLCFFYRRPFRIWQIKITDRKYDIDYITRPFCPKAEPLVLPSISFPAEIPIGSLFSIYREGMNSVDIAYRFISFFKIYEAWYKDKNAEKYFYRNKQSKPKITITENLLGDAYRKEYHDEYVGKEISSKNAYEKLLSIRNYLSHPFLDRNTPPSYYHFDQLNSSQEIEALSNLIERIATKILVKELELWANFREDFKNLLQVYRDSPLRNQ